MPPVSIAMMARVITLSDASFGLFQAKISDESAAIPATAIKMNCLRKVAGGWRLP